MNFRSSGHFVDSAFAISVSAFRFPLPQPQAQSNLQTPSYIAPAQEMKLGGLNFWDTL